MIRGCPGRRSACPGYPQWGESWMSTLLELKNIYKWYPGVTALENVSLSLEKGEVHALLGENGAGKSTLIKVLAGAIKPDGGEIIMDGRSYTNITPFIAQRLGIQVIYQEFNLVPGLSIAENIFLGCERKKGILLDKKSMIDQSKVVLNSIGVNINPVTLVKQLTVAYRQIVEIAKAISKEVRILVMDEPTAPLTNHEVQALFALVHNLKQRGVTVIYISHRLEELFEISDKITVLRDGKFIDTVQTASTSKDELIRLMVGRPLSDQYPKRKGQLGNIALEAKNVSTNQLLKDVSVSVREGEILGIAGLVGSGRTELARIIFGADKPDSGEVLVSGAKANINSPEEAIANGIALIPEDRKLQGILQNMSVGHNITLASIRKFTHMKVIKKHNEQKTINDFVKKLSIKTPSIYQLVKNLSGGNQQKVVLAKWLSTGAKVYLFDEPTRGIDVGAKHEIYTLMNALVEQGNAIIMISSELPEILGMSDRILVMCEGRVAGVLPIENANQDEIMRLASGA